MRSQLPGEGRLDGRLSDEGLMQPRCFSKLVLSDVTATDAKYIPLFAHTHTLWMITLESCHIAPPSPHLSPHPHLSNFRLRDIYDLGHMDATRRQTFQIKKPSAGMVEQRRDARSGERRAGAPDFTLLG